MAKLLNVPQKSGLLIQHLSTKGAAAKIGLVPGVIPVNIAGKDIMLGGDIILGIAGINIKHQDDLYLIKNRVNTDKSGEEISIIILREGQILNSKFKKP
ncbi:hypothetical protein FUA22_04980 [Seonamhaeicola maritimus]|uniref:PDZ domain-containing protein n=2 Tax=Seonamhaeicola maritimus TaxID=2591822 RepID=A0A5C7GLN2_9FLAO|nr:hypothetical protein FUA22_04980 [Seonamhaeicola maritimus]